MGFSLTITVKISETITGTVPDTPKFLTKTFLIFGEKSSVTPTERETNVVTGKSTNVAALIATQTRDVIEGSIPSTPLSVVTVILQTF